MLIRILFWFIVFYSLFKFLIRIVLPLIATTRTVRSKVKDMRQNMGEFEANNTAGAPAQSQEFVKREAKPTIKDDYIDFEEIK